MLESITYHTFLEALGVIVLGYFAYMIAIIPISAYEVRKASKGDKQ